jgi:TatD DNase family protein
MLERAHAAGIKSMIITGGSLEESKHALALAKAHGIRIQLDICFGGFDLLSIIDVYATIGCHPTRSNDFNNFPGGPSKYLQALDKLIKEHVSGPGRVVAVGECGLGTHPIT